MGVLKPLAAVEMMLKRVPILSKLERAVLSRLAQAAGSQTTKDGQAIIRQGDAGDSVYIIKAGEAVVSVEGAGEVGRKQRGSYFGELALLENSPRTATVTAHGGPVELITLSRVVFEQFMSASARIELLVRSMLTRCPACPNLSSPHSLSVMESLCL